MVEIFKPETTAQVVDAVAWANSEDAPVEILGTGTKRGFGRPMGDGNRTIGHAVDLSGLSGITLYEPEELILTAGAGTPLAEIEAAVAEKNQMLAFEPPHWARLYGHDGGTIGGMIACNLAGPRRVKAGAARDHILGIEAVTGRGELVKSGGRVVKNVTGYDLSKLLTGSFGTLAALTEITIKVLPSPEAVETIFVMGLSEAEAVRAMSQALNSSHEVSAAAHVPASLSAAFAGGGDAITAIRIEGFVPSVAARSAALQELWSGFGAAATFDTEASLAFWAGIRDVAPFLDSDADLWRLSVTPTEAPVIADAIGAPALMDWGGGLIWCAAEAGASDTIRGALSAHGGGHATLVRGSEETRRTTAVFEPQPAPLAALSARVKDSFDPARILNPGRMYEGV